MFLNHGITIVDFNEETPKLGSRNKILNLHSIHNTLNEMIIKDSSKSENIDEETPIQKINKRFAYNKDRRLDSQELKIESNFERVEEKTSFYPFELQKKSVISHRLNNTLSLNKRIRKRLINLSYKSWLRTEQINQNNLQLMTLELNNNPTFATRNKDYFETVGHYDGKILLYGLYKSLRDTRPHKCPYRLVKNSTHLNHGSTVFPKKGISPTLQKRCICEHFSIIKSPLK